MPYFSIETNEQIDSAVNEDLMKKATKFLAEMMGTRKIIVILINSVILGLPFKNLSRLSKESISPLKI